MCGSGYSIESLNGDRRVIWLIDDNGLYPKALHLDNNLWDGYEDHVLDVSVDGTIAVVRVRDYMYNEYEHRFELDSRSNIADYVGTTNL